MSACRRCDRHRLSAIKKGVVYIVCTMTPRYSNILTCINQYMIIVLHIYILYNTLSNRLKRLVNWYIGSWGIG